MTSRGFSAPIPVILLSSLTRHEVMTSIEVYDVSRRDLARLWAVPQYGNRPQEGAAEANITASCKAARMFRTKHYDPVEAFEGGHYGPLARF